MPADARTREQFEWLAEEIVEAGGTAAVWLACPSSTAEERRIAAVMAAARAEEYRLLHTAAEEACRLTRPDERRRALTRLREQARQIHRRDFFRPPEREQAPAVLARLAELAAGGAPGVADERTRAESS